MQALENRKKLVLVDGSSYLFRAYHALPPLTTSTGIPTGAVYGVVNMLRKLLVDEKPDYIGVIFDTKSKNFRHALYPDYKANRAAMPPELSVQIPYLHELIRALGLPLIAIEGIEADDVIATLAAQASSQQLETIISTGDKDLAQLVDEHVSLVNTMTGSRLDIAGVKLKFGVRPDQIVDYLTLMGDPVDNVPGIPKVGPKTAVKWLEEHETLDNIIERAPSFKGKIGEGLRAHLQALPLGKSLVTVRRDMPVGVLPQALARESEDPEALKILYATLEFKNWLKDLNRVDLQKGAGPQRAVESQESPVKLTMILDKPTLLSFMTDLAAAGAFVMIPYADQADPLQAVCLGIAFATTPGEAAYLPLGHDYPECPTQLSASEALAILKPLLENPLIAKMGHHLKYALHLFVRYGILMENIREDVLLQSYVLNSTAGKHDIASITKRSLNDSIESAGDAAESSGKQLAFQHWEQARAGAFAAMQASNTLRSIEELASVLAESPALLAVYREIEMALVPVLWQMEEYGIRIDADKLRHQSEQLGETLIKLEEEAYLIAGEMFNLGSPKQLAELFYEKLGLPILAKTPKGAPSTAESVLQQLSESHALPAIILQHRTLSKLKSTYSDKLPLQINPHTQRVHTVYQQAVTATGRLSSTDPNLQNIPIRTPEGKKIRQAFIAAPGYQLLSADYSQIELRIMAHLSQDDRLVAAFNQGEDIHRFTASEIFGIPLIEVNQDQRRSAKAINFGLIYGMSAFGVAKQLGIPREAAQAYMNQYFLRYPGVKQYMESTRENAEKLGYVETVFGRRLYLPDIRAKNGLKKRAAERAAINAPMQGTAADIIKKAMIVLANELKQYDPQDIKMLLQVHDELVFEVKTAKIEQASALIKQAMENTTVLSVPLVVDLGVGENWDEAH